MFATLRREAPVYAHPTPDGGHFWCVTRHDDLVAVNRDNATFSSNRAGDQHRHAAGRVASTRCG